jgi:hypothetical protein
MERQLRDKWITALRSGQYQQGQSYLKSNGAYCCLGVLCEIAGHEAAEHSPDGIVGFLTTHAYPDDEPASEFAGPDGREESTATLSHRMLEELGLTGFNQDDLIEMNDTEAKNFDEIADWIEGNL